MTEAVGDTGHTSFMTPEERASSLNDLSGKYVGIGVRIDVAEDGLPLVIGVFTGSPAEAAGIKVGDEIVAVDGKTTDRPRRSTTIVGWVRGEAGSSVKVTVRAGADGHGARVYDGPRRRGRRAGLLDDGPRHEDRAASASTSSRRAPPTTSRRPSARSARPAPTG